MLCAAWGCAINASHGGTLVVSRNFTSTMSGTESTVSAIAALAAVLALVIAPFSAWLGAKFAAREQGEAARAERIERLKDRVVEAVLFELEDLRALASEAHYAYQVLLAQAAHGDDLQADIRRATFEMHGALERLTRWVTWTLVHIARRAALPRVGELADAYLAAVPPLEQLETNLGLPLDEVLGAVEVLWRAEASAYDLLVKEVRKLDDAPGSAQAGPPK
jgi:hypothetical protein